MREERYQWALKHKDWSLEDWKNVIWSDETLIVMGVRRGSTRVWRQTSEKHDKSCVRPRWKGFSEFMFWGAFSWDHKAPCHIYKKETAQQKKEADEAIKLLNKQYEPIKRLEWELSTEVSRLGLRNKPGRKLKWKFDKKRGKLDRIEGGGIDWWRYKTEVLE